MTAGLLRPWPEMGKKGRDPGTRESKQREGGAFGGYFSSICLFLAVLGRVEAWMWSPGDELGLAHWHLAST